MIITALALCYTTTLCFLYGLLIYRVFGWFPKQPDNPTPVPQVALAGICVITALASLGSFFVPINKSFHFTLLLGAAGILAWSFKHIRTLVSNGVKFLSHHPVISFLFVVAVLLAVYEGSREPQNFDTGLYHAQFIRWTETFPVVPGLGNFSDRLAFNSAWLMFATVIHLEWILPLPFHAPSLVLYLILIMEVCARLAEGSKNHLPIASIMTLLVFPLTHLLFRTELSSPGTDLPAALLTWLIVIYTIDHAHPKFQVAPTPVGPLFMLAGFAITVKLSTAPILLLPLALWIWRKGVSPFSSIQNGLAMSLTVLPWLGRNIFLSGYLIYPFPQIDLFSLNWKIPYEKAVGAQQWIKAWARVPGREPEEVFNYSFRVWTLEWWSKMSNLNQTLLIATLIISGMYCISILILWMKKKGSFILPSPLIGLTTAVALLGAIYWFWQAPDIRFGYGFIGVLLVLPVATILTKVWPLRLARLVAVLALIAYQVTALAEATDFTRWRSRWYVANPYPRISLVKFEQHNFEYFMPDQGTQCWYEAIPCNPFPNSDARLRGIDISDGFIDATRQPPLTSLSFTNNR